jgi:hypothetical protein
MGPLDALGVPGEPPLHWRGEGRCHASSWGEEGSLLRDPLVDVGLAPDWGCDFGGWWLRRERWAAEESRQCN